MRESGDPPTTKARFLGERGVSEFRSSGLGSSLDRSRRGYQIKDSKVTAQSSDGRFGSICRLVVAKSSSSHFIFLDRSLVLWLEGTLQVASSQDWKLPTVCDSASTRRTISVSTFSTATGRNLKIAELCSNGKCFFVLIPSDEGSTGWWSLLRLLQSWIAAALAPPPPLLPTRKASGAISSSFAQVVRGPSLSSQGSCESLTVDGVAGIKVDFLGVSDRLKFLDCCVVFRFCSHEPVDWSAFRRWAMHKWDAAADTKIQRLGDGLWLMFVDSKSKVDKIINQNHWSFGERRMLIDRWIPSARRSNVLLKDDVVWIIARGIPIHLRSQDLFRKLGSACGDYLEHEDCESLSSIRIKIKLSGTLPEEVPICFEDRVFSVSIEKESVDLPKALPISSVSKGRWRNKGKVALFPKSAPPVSEICSSSKGPMPPIESLAPPSSALGPSPEVDNSRVVSIGSHQRTDTTDVSIETEVYKPRNCCNFVGLRLDSSDRLWISSFSGLNSKMVFSLCKSVKRHSSFVIGASTFNGPNIATWALSSFVPHPILAQTIPDTLIQQELRRLMRVPPLSSLRLNPQPICSVWSSKEAEIEVRWKLFRPAWRLLFEDLLLAPVAERS
ncbi:hypothetical protein LINPERHAP2_LOCUS32378 [Linum perenne]